MEKLILKAFLESQLKTEEARLRAMEELYDEMGGSNTYFLISAGIKAAIDNIQNQIWSL